MILLLYKICFYYKKIRNKIILKKMKRILAKSMFIRSKNVKKKCQNVLMDFW